MKGLVVTLGLVALATEAFAQGLIIGGNTTTTLFRTNAAAIGGTAGTASSTVGGTGGYYYELLTANSTVTTVDASLQALLDTSIWTDTGYSGVNSVLGGRVGSTQTAAPQGWAFNTYRSFIIVAWSQAEGADWATVSARLSGAFFLNGNDWLGGDLVYGGYIGASTIQQAQAGGGSPSWPIFALFATTGSAQGTPITTPTDMYIVASPEPTSFALAGLGVAAGVFLRRRK